MLLRSLITILILLLPYIGTPRASENPGLESLQKRLILLEKEILDLKMKNVVEDKFEWQFLKMTEIENDIKRLHNRFEILENNYYKELKNLKNSIKQDRKTPKEIENLWTKGISMNCFRTRHIDLDKEFNYPDDPEDMSHLSYKRYFEKNNIVLPKTLIGSKHLFFAPNVKDKGIELNYYINPEFYGAPKTINGSESKSEYHRDNIGQYPIKKKFMDDWLIQTANYHQIFEKKLKAKSHQLLNLVQFTEKDSPKLTNGNITNQLKSLNDLYKSGVLTKEEFEKAKKKILN